MKQEMAKRWVEALRSGKYKQGYYSLLSFEKTENGKEKKLCHCALGVLFQIVADDLGVKAERLEGRPIFASLCLQHITAHTGACNLTPRSGVYQHMNITMLNDSYKLTFNELAKIIEDHWEDM